MVHKNLPDYLSGDPEGTLVFDIPTFLAGAGLMDTRQRRLDVGEIALRVVLSTYPRVREVQVEGFPY